MFFLFSCLFCFITAEVVGILLSLVITIFASIPTRVTHCLVVGMPLDMLRLDAQPVSHLNWAILQYRYSIQSLKIYYNILIF